MAGGVRSHSLGLGVLFWSSMALLQLYVLLASAVCMLAMLPQIRRGVVKGWHVMRLCAGCVCRTLSNRSHAPLMEAGVDLVNIMKDEGFYVTQRTLSNGTASRTATDGGGAGFGRPVPIQLPTLREVEKDTEGFVSTINKLTSPVFYSTTADGCVVKGLGGIPMTRPLLLVGNHQLFAADMYPMIQEFVQELGVLPRGLAHPVVFAGPDVLAEAGAQGGMAGGGNQAPEDRNAGAMQFGSLLSTYGAVPVSGRNMHKLLEQGEMVLLYPGGAREVRGQDSGRCLGWVVLAGQTCMCDG